MGVELDGFDDLEAKLTVAEEAVNGNPEAVVGTNVEYAPYVEFGTGPHEITPTDADALAFDIGGETVFAHRVMHPGTPAQPFMRPAARKTAANLGDIADNSSTIDELVFRAAAYAERVAKRRAPVDTGTLHNSIGWQPQ
jgi:phage gpG-like protein